MEASDQIARAALLADPVAAGEMGHATLSLQAAGMALVDILETGRERQPGGLWPVRQVTVFRLQDLAFDQLRVSEQTLRNVSCPILWSNGVQTKISPQEQSTDLT